MGWYQRRVHGDLGHFCLKVAPRAFKASIFASADPCRKLAILQSENDHLGYFCLKVAPRAFKGPPRVGLHFKVPQESSRFSPPRTPAENWLFYRAKMTSWDTFASKSLPGPSKPRFSPPR